MNILTKIQSELNAPKNQRNNFWNYNYRSCEDILTALKPLLKENEATVIISDEVVEVWWRIYVRATATIKSKDFEEKTTAFAREQEIQKWMNEAQITWSASSYARKYALNWLFAIDDTKDADATNTHWKTQEVKKSTTNYANNDDLPWMDDITFKKIEDNKGAFINKFWDANTALKDLRTKYKVATKYADKIKELF